MVISAAVAFTDKSNKQKYLGTHKNIYSFLITSVAQSSSYNRYKSNSLYPIDKNVNTNTYINR